MVRDGEAVDARFAGLVARYLDGEAINVAAACRTLGVSRETFYKYVARFREEGVDGLFPRSRAPLVRPRTTPIVVQDAIVLARKRLAEAGLDCGAISIGWWLEDHRPQWQPPAEDHPIPARATIHRVLVAHGMVTAAPAKKPRRATRRFVRARANELWQMDGYEFALSDASTAVVIEVIDDHSRLNLAAQAGRTEDGATAWAAFTAAAADYGLPEQVLTDNGSAFSGTRRGWTAAFDAGLRALGVRPITSSVAHPQTCGKVERGHGTARRWLARQPTPDNLEQLQQLLDRYRQVYADRRHQALGGLTPAHAYRIAERSGPTGEPLTHPLIVTTPPVSPNGTIAVHDTIVGIGRRHAGLTATVFRTGDHVTVFLTGQLIRELDLDHSKRYQPRDH